MPTHELSNQDIRWLSLAFDLAQSSPYPKPGLRVGAAIIYRGKMVGCGVNTMKSHPYMAKINKRSNCLHAEIAAILAAQKVEYNPSRATIYVARSRRNHAGVSYPCEFCWPVIQHVGIGTIVCYDRSGNPQKLYCE